MFIVYVQIINNNKVSESRIKYIKGMQYIIVVHVRIARITLLNIFSIELYFC